MPSLNALREFKASFANIGGQKADMLNRKIPYDDLELPEVEPESAVPPDTGPQDAGETDLVSPAGDIDFSAFMGTPVDNLPDLPPPATDLPNQTAEKDNGRNDGPGNADAGSGFPEPPLEEDSLGALDLDSLDNFDFPEEFPVTDNSRKLDHADMDGFDFLEEALAADTPLDGGSPDIAGLDSVAIPEESETFDLGPLDDLNIPAEPEPLPTTDEAENVDLGSLDDFDMPAEPEPLSTTDEPENFDLGSLDDFDLPAEPESLPTTDEAENLDLGSFDDFDLPAEPEPLPTTDEPENLDLGSLDDFDLPAEPEPLPTTDEPENFDLGSLDDFDMPAEPEPLPTTDEAENFDLGSLDDFDLPAEPEPLPTTDEPENLDLGSLDDFDLPAEPEPLPTTDEPENLDLGLGSLDDFDLPAEPETTSADETGTIDFDLPADGTQDDDSAGFDLGDIDDIAAGGKTGDPFDGLDDLDDFSLPDLDDIINKSRQEAKSDTTAKAADKEKKWGWGKANKEKPGKKAKETVPDDVEELQLTEDELEGLQETLSRYPINLRIACEEIIAEQVIDPKMMSELIEHLVWGASAQETAVLASRILGRTITVPKAFEKSTGEALEAEQASFAYIFVHNFLPTLRICLLVALAAASLFYLVFKFVYIPLKAESIYKIGHERIFAGEYQRANERFSEAFEIHRKKNWFYQYAEAFRDERQYRYAEQKYDELLSYYPRDKKGILDYAGMETYYLRNYAKADNILRRQLLDYAPNDREGLLAAGDNSLMWGEIEPAKYEDARYCYARLLEKYGWKAPVVERMMRYFIRTDQLRDVLSLKNWFDNNPKWELSPEMLGELGGYLLDKKLEEARGVPNEYIEHIDGIRDLLLNAVYTDPALPEPHYHLARYYQSLGNDHEERVSLRIAVKAFEDAPEESIRRLNYRIDAHRRYADTLIRDREFIPAEEQLVKGINLYEDAISRRLISRTPQYGRLYAGLGDLEYFTKTGDMDAALRYYHRSEENGWAPPEMQYRMGAAYYQLENWKNALEYLFAASSSLPLNQRILFAMGNAALKRGDSFAAHGYYNRLLDILENQRSRLPVLLPNDRPEYLELAERLMMARNNAGVACEMLAAQTGDGSYHTRALALYAESERAWDARTRDPRSMVRSGSTPLPYLNTRNALYPQAGYEPQIFIRIDREVLENSLWEKLAPR